MVLILQACARETGFHPVGQKTAVTKQRCQFRAYETTHCCNPWQMPKKMKSLDRFFVAFVEDSGRQFYVC